ncbi:translation initiation factor IF-2-like [Perognathus longimembris pacificus]|uniref:translation initiation factor IF-2-like n=1 Tax=Perognathus longimembris pacificus TaxID=214514 RepID=UPI002018E4E8|nr:translation initiation factor IF-2-like [Perognathus longimembris pacificus]
MGGSSASSSPEAGAPHPLLNTGVPLRSPDPAASRPGLRGAPSQRRPPASPPARPPGRPRPPDYSGEGGKAKPSRPAAAPPANFPARAGAGSRAARTCPPPDPPPPGRPPAVAGPHLEPSPRWGSWGRRQRLRAREGSESGRPEEVGGGGGRAGRWAGAGCGGGPGRGATRKSAGARSPPPSAPAPCAGFAPQVFTQSPGLPTALSPAPRPAPRGARDPSEQASQGQISPPPPAHPAPQPRALTTGRWTCVLALRISPHQPPRRGREKAPLGLVPAARPRRGSERRSWLAVQGRARALPTRCPGPRGERVEGGRGVIQQWEGLRPLGSCRQRAISKRRRRRREGPPPKKKKKKQQQDVTSWFRTPRLTPRSSGEGAGRAEAPLAPGPCQTRGWEGGGKRRCSEPEGRTQACGRAGARGTGGWAASWAPSAASAPGPGAPRFDLTIHTRGSAQTF